MSKIILDNAEKVFKQRYYSMLSRCEKDINYKDISVCNAWHDYSNFKFDMYDDFLDKYKELNSLNLISLERKSPFDNYYKNNCIWIDKRLQVYNKRNTIYATNPITGEKEPLSILCIKFNINYSTVMARHNKQGMSYEKALIQDVYDNKLSVFDEVSNMYVDFTTYCKSTQIFRKLLLM